MRVRVFGVSLLMRPGGPRRRLVRSSMSFYSGFPDDNSRSEDQYHMPGKLGILVGGLDPGFLQNRIGSTCRQSLGIQEGHHDPVCGRRPENRARSEPRGPERTNAQRRSPRVETHQKIHTKRNCPVGRFFWTVGLGPWRFFCGSLTWTVRRGLGRLTVSGRVSV